MSGIVGSHQSFITALKALLAGMKTSMPAGLTQLAAGGKVSLLTDLEIEVQAILAVYQTAEDAALAHANAVKARDDLALTAIPRVEAIRASVKAALGKKSPDLPKVGLQPNKTPPAATVEQKKASVAKAKATRAARGTMGKKQKLAIHGQVPPAPPKPPGP